MNYIHKLQAENARLRELIGEAEEQLSFMVAYLHSAKFHGPEHDWVCVSNDILPKVRNVLNIIRTASADSTER